MVRKMILLAIGASALAMSSAASAGPITYNGSQQVGSIFATYSIVTDGTLGSTDYTHITAFTMTLSDSLSSVTYGRTTAGGTGSLNGDFIATLTDLTIPLFDSLTLFTNAIGPNNSSPVALTQFWWNHTSAQMADAAHFNGIAQSNTTSNQNLAFASVSATPAVPEPATWSMMLLGFGAMGYAVRRRAKVTTRIKFA